MADWSQYAVSAPAAPPPPMPVDGGAPGKWAQYAVKSEPQVSREPGTREYLGQVADMAKAAGEGVLDVGRGIYQQAKDIVSPPPPAEAKYKAQHALDAVDPDVLIKWIKDKYDAGDFNEQDLHTIARTAGSLGTQALLGKAGESAAQNPEAIRNAAGKTASVISDATDVAGTAIKGGAKGIAEGHKGPMGLAVPVAAGVATAIPGVGKFIGLTIEGLYDAYQAVKGAKGALAERAAQQALDAKTAEFEARVAAHRAANPPQAPDPNYTSAAPVQRPIDPIRPAVASARAMGPQPAPSVRASPNLGNSAPPIAGPIQLTPAEVQQIRADLQAKIAARQQIPVARVAPSLGNSAPPVSGPIEPIRGPLPSGRMVGGPQNVPASPEAREFMARTADGTYQAKTDAKAPEAEPRQMTAPEFENRSGVADRTAAVAKKNDFFKSAAEFDSEAGQAKLQKIAQQQGISKAKDGGYKKFSPETIEGIRARLFPDASGDPVKVGSGSDAETDYSDLLKASLARLKK